jgi:2-amino-4-hydroxy-6-hydroxymethyldihydropteridine diphosphokinase
MGKKLVVHLGSNCGNKLANLKQAIEELNTRFGLQGKLSHFYETAAWGKTDQENFINSAALYDLPREWDPIEVLTSIVEIETLMGRERFEKWGPRIIDIDIIYFDDEVVQNKVLQIPHPLLQERRFVLAPLMDIIPEFKHPVLHDTTKELMAKLNDDLEVCRID